MEQLTTTSILSLFESNKEQRQSFISSLMMAIDRGDVNPLKVYYQMKCCEKIFDELTNTDASKNKDGYAIAKRFKELVMKEVDLYPEGKQFGFFNSTMKKQEVAVKYDYSKCNDPVLAELTTKLELLKKEVENRQLFLRAVPEKGLEIRIEDELITVYPPAKSSTTSVVVILK